MPQEFSVSLRGSGDLIKDGFPTEDAAYQWLHEQDIEGGLDGFIVEPSSPEDDLCEAA
jgi:hypothetical protein